MNERTSRALSERFHERKLHDGGSQRRWRTVLVNVLQQLNGVCRDGALGAAMQWGRAPGSSGCPVVPTLGAPVPMEGQSKDSTAGTYVRKTMTSCDFLGKLGNGDGIKR
jgi:hypothetical protein